MAKKGQTRKLKLDHLTPDRVLDVAYCYYVASDDEVGKLPVGRLARRVVRDFEELSEKTPHNGRDWVFLFACQQIIVSLAKGIGRRKLQFEDRLRVAVQIKERQIERISDSTRQAGILRALGKAAAVGGLAFIAARLLSVRLDTGPQNQPTMISFASSIAAILVFAYLKSYQINRQIARIFDMFEHSETHAYREYQQGALEEYLRAKRDAARAWERYTGRDAPEWPGFETVMEEELHLHKTHKTALDELQASPVGQALRWMRRYILQYRSREEVIEDHLRKSGG